MNGVPESSRKPRSEPFPDLSLRTPESPVSFAQLKKNADGLVPVIVQDYKNDEVLMLAYMNEEAYNKTIETGRMTYYSRSRQKLWLKGEESGHFQYVKSLSADCDSVATASTFSMESSVSISLRSSESRIISGTLALRIFSRMPSVTAAFHGKCGRRGDRLLRKKRYF